MDQITFSEAEYRQKKHKTRREKFLEQMELLIPWKRLERKIRPHYPKNGRGRQPYPLSTLLRIHCMQLFYNLSDPGMEDALYEIESMRRFAGLRLSDNLPDETTILHFRHLLERHNLGKKLFDEVNRYLKSKGLSMREGSIVDASIISAPTSTKNKAREAFGLRREETIKFISEYADRGDHLVLKDTWTKGKKSRTIPVRTAEQREILDRVRQLAGKGSLIPGTLRQIYVDQPEYFIAQVVALH